MLSVGSQETLAAGVAYTFFTPNESSQYSLNVTAWNANINPSVTATASRAFEFGQLNISSVNYDAAIYTTETAVVSGLVRDFMNSSWLNNATATNISISATAGTFNANWAIVNSTGGFNFTYTPPALSSTGSATITINASYGNITGGWSGTISITPAIGVDTWATNASCASRPSAISEVPTALNDTGLVGYWRFNSVNASNYTADSSGMNNNGQVLNGAALTPSGKFGAGMLFDGTDDYVAVPNANNLDGFTQATWEFWIKPNQNITGSTILSKDQTDGTDLSWDILDNGAGIRVVVGYGGTYWDSQSYGNYQINLQNNQWQHVAVVYNGTNIFTYYNGVQKGAIYAFSQTIRSTAYRVEIGSAVLGTKYFYNGSVDEVRIYNRSLSADEISALYNRTALSLCANVTYGSVKAAGAYVNLTVNRTGTSSYYGPNPANVITNLYDTGTIVSTEITPDESTKYTVTAKAWNPIVSSAVASDTYDYAYGKVNATIALSDNIIYDSETSQVSGKVYDWMNASFSHNASDVTIADNGTFLNNTGLVGLWRFDEGAGTVALDGSGNMNNGTLTNMNLGINNGSSGWTTSGKLGNALQFDGSNDYVNAGTSNSILNLLGGHLDGSRCVVAGANPITLEFWVKKNSSGSWGIVAGRWRNWLGWYVLINSDGTLAIRGASWGSNSLSSSVANVSADTWHHVAVEIQFYQGEYAKFYVDGVLADTISFHPICEAENNIPFTIGDQSGSPYIPFNGALDDVRLYNRSLSATEINDLYNLGRLTHLPTNTTGDYYATYYPPNVSQIQTYTLTANARDADGIYSGNVSTSVKVYPAPSKLNASIYTDTTYYNLGENVTIGVVMRNNESALFTGALLKAKLYRNDTGSLVETVDLPERTVYFAGSYLGKFNTTVLPVGWYYINITTEADSYSAPLPGSGELFYVNPFKLDIGLVSPSCAPSGQAMQGETQRYDLEARNYTTGSIITPLAVSSYWNTSSGLQFAEKLDTYDGIPCSLSVDIIPSNIQEIPGGISLTLANATYGGSDASRMLEYVMKYPFWDDNMTDAKFLEKRVPVEIDNRLSPQIQNAFIEINGSELEAAGVQLSSMSLESIRVIDPRKVPEWPDELWGSEVPYNITDYGSDGYVNQSDKIRFLVNLSENSREYVYIYYTNLSSGFSYAGTSLSGTPYSPYTVKPFEEAPVLITSMRLDKQIYTRYPTVTVNYSIYTPNPSPYPPTVTNTFLQCKIYSPSGSIEVDTGVTQIYNNTYVGSKEMSTTSGLFGEYTLICTATDQVAGKTNIYSQKFLEEEIGTPVSLYPVSFTTTGQTFSISGNTSIASSGAALPEAYVNMSTLACESTFWRGLFGLGPYCEAYQNSTVSSGTGEYSATLTLTIPSDYFDLHVGSNHTYSYANGTFLASGYIYGSNTTQYSVKYAAATNLWLLADNSPYSPVILNLQMNTTSTTQQGVNITYEILNKTSGLSYVNLSSDIVVLNASGGGVNYFTKNWTVDYLPAGEYTVVVRLMQGDWVSGTDSATFYRMNLTHALNTTDTYTNEPIYLNGTLYWPNGTAADENLKIQYSGADVGRLTQNYFVASAAGGTYGMATPLRIPDNNYTLRVASARVMGDDAAKGMSEEAGIKVRLRVLSMLGSDAATYKANTAVNLTLRANSTANWTVGPTAAFNATDRDTFVQAQYNSTWNASLPGMIAFENRTRSYLWNTTNNPPGNYTISSGIIDMYGQLAGGANTTVEIITTKTATISSSLDKSAYSMYELVNISGTINRTGNVEFTGNLTVYVLNQNTGSVCSYCSCGQSHIVVANDSKTTPATFSYGWNTSSYLAGNYLAVSNFTWVDEDGILRSIVSQKTFTIDIVRLAGVSVTTSNTTYALTSPTFNITAAVVNKGNWFTGAGAGGGNLTVKAIDVAGNDDTPTTQGGVYVNAPWYRNPIPTVCNYGSSNYNYTWSTWMYNNKPLNYMPNGLLYVFDKMRDAGNYTIRANYTFEGGSAFSDEKNITVLQSAALTQPPTFYISKKGEPYEGDATSPILAYANEGRWFGLIVTNAGNVEMQNLTANFTVGCSSPPLTLGPYSVKITLGVGSTNTYMLYENASTAWNTRQTPVNGEQNPCVVNALLYTPAIYDGCPGISGGVCVWFDSMAYEPSQTKALNIKKTEAMHFNVTINNNTFTSANADAIVSGTINNTGNVWLNGTISGKIYSLSGAEMAAMACTPPGIISLALSPAQAVNCTWNTGLTEAVNYTANITYNWGTGSNATGIPFSISAIKRASVYVFANASAHNQSADVSITGNVSNIGNYNVTGNLALRLMQGGTAIETINTANNITIGVAGAFNFTFALNTKGYPYGLYNVTATYTYLNENGNATNATGNYLLTINENRSITLSMDTDRASYKSNWGVNITVDLNNTGNAVLSGASLVYTVKQGATPVATYTDNLGDSTVSIGEAYKRSWLWNTGTYAAGTYTVEAKVSDSTLASWVRTKDIQVNATKTASIAGLAVDVMPPSNYGATDTIYVYGIVNATGNVPFSGNLSLRYHNNQIVADTYDNRTGVATGFSMSPPVAASATAIDVGVINLTATYLWIDEDGAARSTSSSATFFIGGTSVSVTFGATNTYNPDDAVPLLVHVAGMGGNITGLTIGNFTITDGIDTYTPPMAEQGSGNYLFTFAKNAFDIGDYAISVTVIDPNTNVPGTGTANLYIRDHWVTVRVDANSALASSETDAGRGYAAAKSGQALVALVQRGGTLDSLSATANNLVMKQKLTANRFNLVMTQGSVKENIRDRIKLIASGEFEKYASPSYGFALTNDYLVSVSRVYDAIDIIGVDVGTFRPGMYNLVIRNDGASNGKTKIVVSRK